MAVSRFTAVKSADRSTPAIGPNAVAGSVSRRAVRPAKFTSPANASVMLPAAAPARRSRGPGRGRRPGAGSPQEQGQEAGHDREQPADHHQPSLRPLWVPGVNSGGDASGGDV